MARLTASGVLDTSFGTGGKTTISFNRGGLNRDAATSMAIDSQSRIVLGGYAEVSTSGNYDLPSQGSPRPVCWIRRLLVPVKPQSRSTSPEGTGEDKAAAVAIGTGDTVLLACSANRGTGVTATAVSKMTTTGLTDTSFGTAGRTTFTSIVSGLTSANSTSAMTVLADGRILLAGTVARSTATNTDFFAGRLTTTGAVDLTFGTNGFTAVGFDRGGQNGDVGNAMTLDSTGNILLAGSVEIGSGNFDDGLARLTANGVLDTSFSLNGLTTVAFDRGGTNADAATGFTVQADGRVVLVGPVALVSGDYDTGVARLELNSALASRLIASGNGNSATTYDINSAGQYTLGSSFTPFSTSAIVRSAVGDVNGDGTPDSVYVIGPGGGSLIRVISGATGQDLLTATASYESQFTGGLYVTVADIDNDDSADIIVSPDVGGGGRVQIFSVRNGALVQRSNFFGIEDTSFRGGARVTAADVNGDGVPDLLVCAGVGGGPRVALFDGTTLFTQTNPTRLIGDFFVFPGTDATNLRNGVFATMGDVTGDGKADMIFGGGPGGGPRVFALDGNTVLTSGASAAQASPVANFFVGNDTTSRGGVRLAVKDIDGDSLADIITASGDGLAASIHVYLGRTFRSVTEPPTNQVVNPFDGVVVSNGVFVG